jgi:hypothetical protein
MVGFLCDKFREMVHFDIQDFDFFDPGPDAAGPDQYQRFKSFAGMTK